MRPIYKAKFYSKELNDCLVALVIKRSYNCLLLLGVKESMSCAPVSFRTFEIEKTSRVTLPSSFREYSNIQVSIDIGGCNFVKSQSRT
jgi:hypothetical protein